MLLCGVIHSKQCHTVVLMTTPSNTTKCAMSTETHGEHSQDFFGLLPDHSEAEGFVCYLQNITDVAGWVTVEAGDVLMGDLEPLLVGIGDLRRGNRQRERGLISHGHVPTLLWVTFVFVPLLFHTAFRVKQALITGAFEINLTGLDLSHYFLRCCQRCICVSMSVCACVCVRAKQDV